MSYSEIEAALTQTLMDTGLEPIQYPNAAHVREDGATFARCFMLSCDEAISGLGPDGVNKSGGVFQVNVHVPTGTGRSSWISTIETAFRRLAMASGNTDVYVNGVSVSQPIDDNNYQVTPITINFYANSR